MKIDLKKETAKLVGEQVGRQRKGFIIILNSEKSEKWHLMEGRLDTVFYLRLLRRHKRR